MRDSPLIAILIESHVAINHHNLFIIIRIRQGNAEVNSQGRSGLSSQNTKMWTVDGEHL